MNTRSMPARRRHARRDLHGALRVARRPVALRVNNATREALTHVLTLGQPDGQLGGQKIRVREPSCNLPRKGESHAHRLSCGRVSDGFLRLHDMRSIVAVLLAGFMIAPPQSLRAQTINWDTVRDLPPGTQITIQLRTGSEVRGTVLSTTPDMVSLEGGQKLASADVASANVRRMANRYSSQTPNANAVRHVITALGPGKNVRLKTLRGRNTKGHVTAIGQQSFSFRRNGQIEEIPFGDVRELRGAGMHWGVKTAIIAGAVFGALLAIGGICYESEACMSF